MRNINDELNNFTGLSLKDIELVNLMNRVDTKFVFTRSQFTKFLPELSQFYNCLDINNERIQTYQSLYFDDERFSFFRDHHNRKNNRFKVRIRNYVNSDLTFLEIKHKQKKRTDKTRIKVNGFLDEFDKVQKEFLEESLGNSKKLMPVLKNQFDRISLSGKDYPERLTLDLNIKFKWQNTSFDFEDLVIAELKQSDLNRNSPFFQIMKEHQIRPMRVSKYCIGLYLLHGQDVIKGNRFKRKIKLLNKLNSENNELVYAS